MRNARPRRPHPPPLPRQPPLPSIICPLSCDAIRQVWLLPRWLRLDPRPGSVARKPRGLCAPHVVPFNLLGRFPGGAQSLTAGTGLSLGRRGGREEEAEEEAGQKDRDTRARR